MKEGVGDVLLCIPLLREEPLVRGEIAAVGGEPAQEVTKTIKCGGEMEGKCEGRNKNKKIKHAGGSASRTGRRW